MDAALGKSRNARSDGGDGIDTMLWRSEKLLFKNWSVFATKTMPLSFHLRSTTWNYSELQLQIDTTVLFSFQWTILTRALFDHLSSSSKNSSKSYPLIGGPPIGNLLKQFERFDEELPAESTLDGQFIQKESRLERCCSPDSLSIEEEKRRTRKSNIISSLF